MPSQRYFLDSPLQLHEQVVLTGSEAHHLLNVMRTKVGETVEIVNGRSQLAQGKLLSSDKKNAQLLIVEVHESSPSFPVIICQAIAKINRLETIIEKGTELGMSSLWLFPGERSEKKELSPQQLERMRAIIIAAMKQCGRLDLPSIFIKPPLSKWKDEITYPAYFGDLEPSAPPLSKCWKKEKGVLFFIGPESGFSEKEIEKLKSLGAQGVSLHPNILRTETASLVALSLIFNL